MIAVAQHDDLEVRRLALEAGALRVFSYAKFFEDGPALVARWLAAPEADAERLPDDAERLPDDAERLPDDAEAGRWTTPKGRWTSTSRPRDRGDR